VNELNWNKLKYFSAFWFTSIAVHELYKAN